MLPYYIKNKHIFLTTSLSCSWNQIKNTTFTSVSSQPLSNSTSQETLPFVMTKLSAKDQVPLSFGWGFLVLGHNWLFEWGSESVILIPKGKNQNGGWTEGLLTNMWKLMPYRGSYLPTHVSGLDQHDVLFLTCFSWVLKNLKLSFWTWCILSIYSDLLIF